VTTTATAKVYAPLSGEVWNEDLYSDNTAHVIVKCSDNPVSGHQKPIDIGASANTDVYFNGSAQIKSIRTTRVGKCCARTGQNTHGPWHQSILVRLYKDNGGEQLIGEVLYMHLTDRVANGHYLLSDNNAESIRKKLGKLPKDLCASASDYPGLDCNCATQKCCSEGVHVHMQAKGSGLVRKGYLGSGNKKVKRGISSIYEWTYNT